jgi:phenylalanyl-tRNA synthetase beta chain
VGEILVGTIPPERPAFVYQDYSTFPAIEADLSFAQPREMPWEKVEAFVLGRRPQNLESLRLNDRYEGAGVPEGQVKTTIRLTFRSTERTLSQEEVNRQIQSLARELATRLGVRFDDGRKE